MRSQSSKKRPSPLSTSGQGQTRQKSSAPKKSGREKSPAPSSQKPKQKASPKTAEDKKTESPKGSPKAAAQASTTQPSNSETKGAAPTNAAPSTEETKPKPSSGGPLEQAGTAITGGLTALASGANSVKNFVERPMDSARGIAKSAGDNPTLRGVGAAVDGFFQTANKVAAPVLNPLSEAVGTAYHHAKQVPLVGDALKYDEKGLGALAKGYQQWEKDISGSKNTWGQWQELANHLFKGVAPPSAIQALEGKEVKHITATDLISVGAWFIPVGKAGAALKGAGGQWLKPSLIRGTIAGADRFSSLAPKVAESADDLLRTKLPSAPSPTTSVASHSPKVDQKSPVVPASKPDTGAATPSTPQPSASSSSATHPGSSGQVLISRSRQSAEPSPEAPIEYRGPKPAFEPPFSHPTRPESSNPLRSLLPGMFSGGAVAGLSEGPGPNALPAQTPAPGQPLQMGSFSIAPDAAATEDATAVNGEAKELPYVPPPTDDEVERLKRKLGVPVDVDKLREVFTISDATKPLRMMGNSAMKMAVTVMLAKNYPQATPFALSQMREKLVSWETLSQVGNRHFPELMRYPEAKEQGKLVIQTFGALGLADDIKPSQIVNYAKRIFAEPLQEVGAIANTHQLRLDQLTNSRTNLNPWYEDRELAGGLYQSTVSLANQPAPPVAEATGAPAATLFQAHENAAALLYDKIKNQRFLRPDIRDPAEKEQTAKELGDILGAPIPTNRAIEALTHDSYLRYKSMEGSPYHRLEFYGDGLWDYVVVKSLFERFHDKPHQLIGSIKMYMTSNKYLGEMADKLGIPKLAYIHPHYDINKVVKRKNIKADLMEASLGAMGKSMPLDDAMSRMSGFLDNEIDSTINNNAKLVLDRELTEKGLLTSILISEFNEQTSKYSGQLFLGNRPVPVSQGSGTYVQDAANEAAQKALEKLKSVDFDITRLEGTVE